MLSRVSNRLVEVIGFAAAITCLNAATATFDFSTDPTLSGLVQMGGNGANIAPWVPSGGNPGGFLALTYPQFANFTSFVFSDLDQGKPVVAFTFETDLRIGNPTGNRAADGFSISFARLTDPIFSSLPDSASNMSNWAGGIAEGGATTGISIDFDTRSGNALPDGGDVEGILVRVENKTVLRHNMPTRNGSVDDTSSIQTGPRAQEYWANGGDPIAPESWASLGWAHLKVDLDSAGKLTVSYKNQIILDQYQTTYFPGPGRLVLAGRTGLANEHTHFDNLKLTTTTVTDAALPTTPGPIHVAVAGSRLVSIDWPASTDDSGHVAYRLSRDGTPIGDLAFIPSFTDSTVAPGKTYRYSVVAVDPSGNRSDVSVVSVTTPNETPDVGFLLAEIFDKDGASSFFPAEATRGRYLNGITFGDPDFGDTFGDNFFIRITGTLTPTETGAYDFFVRSNDSGRFYLNPTGPSLPNTVIDRPIAVESGCCNSFQEPGFQQTTVAPIPLTAGKSYGFAFEVLEGGGGDWGQVAWRKVGDPTPANQLKPIQGIVLTGRADSTGANITVTSPPASVTVNNNDPAQFDVSAVTSSPYDLSSYTSSSVLYQWYRNGVLIPGATTSSYRIPVVSAADNGAKFKLLIAIPGLATTTSEATLTVLPDTQKPTVVSVTADGSLASATVVFSEPVVPPSATTPSHYKFSGGLNVLSATQLDSKTVRLTTSPQTEGASYRLTVNNVQDNSGNPATAATGVLTAWGFTQGKAKYEVWTGVQGSGDLSELTSLSRYPNQPDLVEIRDGLEGRLNWADNFGARLSTFITPPADGDYVFFVSANESAELWLSTDSNPANKKLIAKDPQWHDPYQWLDPNRRNPTNPENRSDKFVGTQWPTGNRISLKVNTRYYLEALQRETGGADCITFTVKSASDPDPRDGEAFLNTSFFGTLAPPLPGNPPVNSLEQFITFGPFENLTLGGSPISLTAAASSGLPVSLSVVSGPGVLSGNLLSLTGVGTVVVSASQAGNAIYQAAPDVTQSFTVVGIDRSLVVASVAAVQEGETLLVPVSLSSFGNVGSLSFQLNYDPAVLADAHFDWTGVAGNFSSHVDATTSGQVTASVAFGGITLPPGTVQLGVASFRVRSVPGPKATTVTPVLTAISDGIGAPWRVGNGTVPGIVNINPRKVTGDNNANRILDIGDAVVISRLVDGLEERRAWDAALNDVNGSGELETGDVSKVLRTVVGLDPQPHSTGSIHPQGIKPAGINSGDVATLDFPDGVVGKFGQPIRVVVKLAQTATPISGVDFTLSYPDSLSLVSKQTGPVVPGDSIQVWNDETGLERFAAVRSTAWTDRSGVLGVFTFVPLASFANQVEWPISITSINVTGNGFDLRPMDAALGSIRTPALAPQTILFRPIADQFYSPGLVVPLEATASSGLPVIYSVISGPGTVQANRLSVTGVGQIVIAASQFGDATFAPSFPVTQTLKVNYGIQTLSFGALEPVTFSEGKTVALNAASSVGLPVSFSVVSGPAKVAGNVLVLTGSGSVVVAAFQAGNDLYAPANSVTQSLFVFEPTRQAQTVSFQSLAPVNYSASLSVPLSASASSGLPVAFNVVSGPGVISGNFLSVTGAGHIVISAVQPGNGSYSPATAVTQSLLVNRGNNLIRFQTIPSVAFAPSLTVALSATASSGLPVQLEVLEGPASILGGQLNLSGAGTIRIRATQSGDSNFEPADPLVQSVVVSKGVQRIDFNHSERIQYTPSLAIPLAATSSAGLPVSYRVESGPALLVGSILAIRGAGSVVLTAIQEGNSNYLPADSVSRTIQVIGRDQSLSFIPPANLIYSPGKQIELSASSSSGLPVSFTVDSGSASISENVLTLQGAGSIQITARQDGDTSYSPAEPQTRTVTVSKATQSITFEPDGSLPLGSGPLLLKASATSDLPVQFTIQSGPGILDGSALAPFGVGSVVVAADQPGDANYLPATAVVRSISVIPGVAVQRTQGPGEPLLKLEVYVDRGSSAVVEEATEFGTWLIVQTISGQGASTPVVVPLNTSAGASSRFWRVRILQ